MEGKITICDTTLSVKSAPINIKEKIALAMQFERLGVDVIEANFDTCEQISKEIQRARICAIAKANEDDIKLAATSVLKAKHKRICIFIPTSQVLMECELKLSPADVIKKAVNAVAYAKTFLDDVEFSCEDVLQSEISFLNEIIEAVIKAGATSINFSDFAGCVLPNETSDFVAKMNEFIAQSAMISVQYRSNLGLATANSLACIKAGARQVKCAINGFSNSAALEEIAVAIENRKDIFSPLYTDIITREIYATSIFGASIIGTEPNKAVVWKNGFLNGNEICQDEVSKDTTLARNPFIFDKHSGKDAFKDKIASLGYSLNDDEISKAFLKFKNLAANKKYIFNDDLHTIIAYEITKIPQIYEFVSLSSNSTLQHCSACVTIKFDNKLYSDLSLGNGAVDALFRAIDKISNIDGILKDYRVNAVSYGKDALANAVVIVEFEHSKVYMGRGLDLDVMIATAKAYIWALNSYLMMREIDVRNEI